MTDMKALIKALEKNATAVRLSIADALARRIEVAKTPADRQYALAENQIVMDYFKGIDAALRSKDAEQ
jgi:hypothetical protein